jgi:putative ABC transport system permease protein
MVQAKRRTILLGVAISVVSCLFLIMQSMGRSVSDRMIEAATTLSAGHVNVGGFYKFRRRGSNPILTGRSELRKIVGEIVPEAELIIDRHRGWGRLIGPSSSINVSLSGLNLEEEQRFFDSLQLRGTRPDGSVDPKLGGDLTNMTRPQSILLFASQAKKLGVDAGDMVTIVTEATGGQTNTIDLTVAAISEDLGFLSNWSAFVSRQVILDLYQFDEDTTGAIMVYLPKIERSAAVMERLRNGLKERGYEIMDHDPNPFFFKFEKVAGEDWLGQRLDLTLWSDEVSFVKWVTAAFDFVTLILILILAAIIAGGITNSMWMAVRERTKEIGTIRAIGVQRRQVLVLFLCEAAILGAVFAFFGSVVGALIILGINTANIGIGDNAIRIFLMTNQIKLTFAPGQVVATVVLFAVTATMAAFFPARRASKLRPIEALGQGK